MKTPHVTVTGAGIVGATIAYCLSRSDARVRLIDARPTPGRGVTGQSFGWINYVTAAPAASAEMYRHRRAAFEHYERLNQSLNGRLFGTRQGSLVWTSSARETERMVERHAAQGSPTRLVDRDEFAKLAPLVAAPPERAAYSPNDFALEPDEASELLVRCARENGVEVTLGQTVDGIHFEAARVAGVRLAGDLLPTDMVVVAAGTASHRLLSDIAPLLGITDSPAALISIAAAAAPLGCILSGPELEVRSRGDNRLLVAASPPDQPSETAKAALGERALANVRRMLPTVRNATVRSVEVSRRPMTTDGGPLVGRMAVTPNVFVAVVHPGVILAPAIGRTIAEQIFDRPVTTELGDNVIGP